MNVLYIIGNGFDKAQGMKTSYPEFYQFLMTNSDICSDLMQQLKEEIKADKELWSDMEIAFGQYSSRISTAEDMENLYFELSDKLQYYLMEEEKSFNPSDKLKNKFVGDFVHPAKYMGDSDGIRYRTFLKRIGSGYDISVMTLNYTDTLEKLLSLGNGMDKKIDNNSYFRQVIHLHGRLGDSIIIGVDNEEQIANVQFRGNDNIKDLLIKEQSNNAMKYMRHRMCENLISNANLIILYGVSLGETDARWWKLIGAQFKKRNTISIIQHLYLPNDITPTRKQLIGRIERGQRVWLMEKMGLKKEEWPDDTNDRLFFITNSNAFK